MKIPLCSHCGEVDGVYANERAYGWAERQYFLDGTEELNIDRINYTYSNTFRCMNCNKIRQDIKRVGSAIAVKK